MASESERSERPARERPVTTRDFLAMKRRGEKIAVLTAYDVLFARVVDEAGMDGVLVGDSVGQVFAGYSSTLPVTLEQMIYHAQAVRRGVRRALLIVDMPFLTYQVNPEEAIRNCGRVLQETGAQAVKLEGGSEAMAETVRRLVSVGIPVMGHLGLTPQSVNVFGGYGLHGREEEEGAAILAAARRLAGAGCFSIVLEMLPRGLAAEITRALPIPTIGIGAGPDCDGQVLVLPDLLGLNEGFHPRFLKCYAELGAAARSAVSHYVQEVKSGGYPGPEHTYE
ncbi:MAG: 3-methyl-2-oxobutanoate hydroxymethyltransferase [Gemmatimonadetes bacterium]|nr:3-methyl-2-oxobutanoate hydroxymethyltransferase [Gemmatimonadota bacterium]